MIVSNNVYARIHKRIEGRIKHHLYKPYKAMREEFAGKSNLDDHTGEIQAAIYAGLITGFVFGKGAIAIREHKKEFLDVADVAYMSFFTNDKDIWHAIAGKTLFKAIMSEQDAYAAYFAPSEGATEFLKQYSFELAQVQMQNISNEAQALYRETLEQGMSNAEAATYLQQGIKDLTNKRAKAIARTESTRAFNLGTLYESQTADIVKGYRYNAVLDKLTTDICRQRDGYYIPKENTMTVANNTPPLHVNCRSRLETVLDGDDKGRLLPADVPDGMQRESDIQATLNFLRKKKCQKHIRTTPVRPC